MIRPTRTRLRNPVAMSPLLRKGGVHKRSKSGVRASSKLETQAATADWREILDEECLDNTTHPLKDSGDDLLQPSFFRYFLKNKQFSFSLLPNNWVQCTVF